MKKSYVLTALLLLFLGMGSVGYGQILTFEFSALAGDEATAASNSNHANITSSTISRGAGLTASGNTGRFNATSWATTSIANAVSGNDYMEFTITPQTGYKFSVTSIVVQWQRSASGNTAISLRSSLDSYASDIDAVKNVTDGTTTQTFTWTFSHANQTSAVTYRFYSYAEATTGSGGPGDGTGNDIVVNGTTASAASSSSDIILSTSFTFPTNINYTSYQGTNPLTSGNSIEVAQFDVRDGGGSTDADALSTILTAINLNVTNSGSLSRIALFDGTTNIGEVAGGASASFSSLSLNAADNGSKTFSIRVSFFSTVTDNQQFSFTVSSATASASGSGFAAANAGGAATTTTGDNNRIEVTASDIVFQQNVSTVPISTVMTPHPTLRAIDANSNLDLDYSSSWSVAVTTGDVTFDGTATISGPFSSGAATLSNLIFDASGTGNIIEATSGSFTDQSSSFDVTDPQPEINIKQDITDYLTGSTYAFGNQTSGTSSLAITFTIENMGSAELLLSDSPKIVKSGTNASEFTINQESTSSPVGVGLSTTFSITFSPTSQGSKTAMISIANNDPNENPYEINLTGTGTVTASSDIVNTAVYSYTANVDYASYQTASTLTTGNSVGVNGLTIRDGGGSSDADNLGTTLTAINFTTGGSTAIRTAALFDGSTNVSEVAINGATTITFSGLNLTASDNGTKDFELRVTYQGTVTDNQQITLTVSSATASSAGSGFAAANAGGAASSVAGDNNKIEVTATKFNFSTQPSNTTVNTGFSSAVEASDANNNRDLDATTSVTLSASAGTLSSATGLTQNLVSGIYSWTDLQNNTAGTGVTLTASGALTSATSTAFRILSAQPAAQASVITFSNIGMTSMAVSWTNGDGANRMLVGKASGTPGTPVDGTTYSDNLIFGSGGTIGTGEFVLYKGSGSTVSVSGLSPNTTYTFKVFEYNGEGGTENYFTTSNASSQTTLGIIYYSTGSFDPSQTTSWNSNRDGSGSSPTNFSSGERFVIENGDLMTTANIWTVSGSNATIEIENGGSLTCANNVTTERLNILAAGNLTVNSSITLTVNNGNSIGFDVNVDGTLINKGTLTFGASASMTVNSGATYIHNTTTSASTLLGSTTLNAGSYFVYRGSSTINVATSFSGRTFGNLTFESSSGALSISASGSSSFTVNGNLTISSGVTISTTMTGEWVIAGNFTNNGTLTNSTGTQVYTFTGTGKTISGNGTISFETWNVNSGASITLGKNVSIGSGFTGTISGTLESGSYTVSGAGAFTISSGATLKTANTAGLNGAITVTGTKTFDAGANYIFNGSADQVTGTLLTSANNITLTNSAGKVSLSGNIALGGALTVPTGNTLDAGTSIISGAGGVEIQSGATLKIGSADGINSSGATGNIQTTIRTFDAGAIYEYNGSSAQVTGTGLPATLSGGLKINNSIGVSPSQPTTVNGTLTLQAGEFNTTTNAITIGSGASVVYSGGSINPSLTPTTVNNYTPPAGTTLTSNPTVNGTLSLTNGNLTVSSGNYIILGSSGSLSGESAGHYIIGAVQTDRTLTGSTGVDIGGMGVVINPEGNNLGTTTVRRVAGADGIVTVGGNSGIKRKWIITPTSQPTGNAVSVTLSWVSDDNNGKTMSALYVWKSTDNGSTWASVAGPFDGSSQSITFTTTSFSQFTLSDNNSPLPVELTSFTAKQTAGAVVLHWNTATEVNNYGFEVQKLKVKSEEIRVPGSEENWEVAGFVQGHGNSNSEKTYSYSDRQIDAATKYIYRLKQIDTDGKFDYSKEVEVTTGMPEKFELSQNYPNPFNPSTMIAYTVPKQANVTLEIFDITGNRISQPVNSLHAPGSYSVSVDFNKGMLSTGMYLYRMTATGEDGSLMYTAINKMILIK